MDLCIKRRDQCNLEQMCTKYLNICLHVNTSKPQKLTVLNWLVEAFHSKPVTLYIWFDIVRENTKLLSTFSNLIVQRKINTRSPSKPVKLLWSDTTLWLICSSKISQGTGSFCPFCINLRSVGIKSWRFLAEMRGKWSRSVRRVFTFRHLFVFLGGFSLAES